MSLLNNKYLVNIVNNNNFYVSNKVIENIHYKIEEYANLEKKRLETENETELKKIDLEMKKMKVSKEELELLELVDERRHKCRSENIHYWIVPNYQTPENTSCHWCSMKISQYH